MEQQTTTNVADEGGRPLYARSEALSSPGSYLSKVNLVLQFISATIADRADCPGASLFWWGILRRGSVGGPRVRQVCSRRYLHQSRWTLTSISPLQ